ncbi:hypothetical protein GW17_00058329 [Ensete ventricosum]|nr:hypothetical protein GW17_00058329 [Ensete ventricosum]RZR95300.1 hypothetical protein BHM03_00024126 [Ensete ventricosum]
MTPSSCRRTSRSSCTLHSMTPSCRPHAPDRAPPPPQTLTSLTFDAIKLVSVNLVRDEEEPVVVDASQACEEDRNDGVSKRDGTDADHVPVWRQKVKESDREKKKKKKKKKKGIVAGWSVTHSPQSGKIAEFHLPV